MTLGDDLSTLNWPALLADSATRNMVERTMTLTRAMWVKRGGTGSTVVIVTLSGILVQLFEVESILDKLSFCAYTTGHQRHVDNDIINENSS